MEGSGNAYDPAGLGPVELVRLMRAALAGREGSSPERVQMSLGSPPKSPASAQFAQARRDLLQTAVSRKEEGVREGAQGTLADHLSSALLLHRIRTGALRGKFSHQLNGCFLTWKSVHRRNLGLRVIEPH